MLTALLFSLVTTAGLFLLLLGGVGFWQFALRFLAMLLLLKAFDVLFFDFFLLCRAGWNFFPHFYPKVKEVLGPYLFGFNRKTNQTHILLFPLAAAILARVCTLF